MSDIEVFEAFLEETGATVWKDFEWQIVIGPWRHGVNQAFLTWDALIDFMRQHMYDNFYEEVTNEA